jgi:hypothetical protein
VYNLGYYTVAADGALAHDKAVVSLNLEAVLPKNFARINDYIMARQAEIEQRSDIKDLISLKEVEMQINQKVAEKCNSASIKVDELEEVPKLMNQVVARNSSGAFIGVDKSASVALTAHFDAFLTRHMDAFESTSSTMDTEDVDIIDGNRIWCQALPRAEAGIEAGHLNSQIREADAIMAKKSSSAFIRVDQSACAALSAYFDDFLSRQMDPLEGIESTMVGEDVDIIDGKRIWCRAPPPAGAGLEAGHLNSQIRKADAIIESSSPVLYAATGTKNRTGMRHFSGAKRSSEDKAKDYRSKRARSLSNSFTVPVMPREPNHLPLDNVPMANVKLSASQNAQIEESLVAKEVDDVKKEHSSESSPVASVSSTQPPVVTPARNWFWRFWDVVHRRTKENI